MPVCIAGMHRSGTSLVAQLLHGCGLDLGPTDELNPANEFNRDGYWENQRFLELDERLLEAAGGAWDVPIAPAPRDWERLPAAALLQEEADVLVANLSLTEPWGWKDPRASLAMGFWQRQFPELEVVVCVRHPVEVAFSLERRGAMSLTLALHLWTVYNSALLDTVPQRRRVITHFDRYFGDPVSELRRVVARLDLPADDTRVEAAAAHAKPALRSFSHRGTEDLPRDVRELYLRLCAEAELAPDAKNLQRTPRGHSPPEGDAATGRPLEELLGLTRLRLGTKAARLEREASHFRDVAAHWQSEHAALDTERERWRTEAERLRAALDGSNSAGERLTAERVELREALEQTRTALHETRATAAALASANEQTTADRDAWRQTADRLTKHMEQSLEAERRLHGETVELRNALEKASRALESLERERDEAAAAARQARAEADSLTATAERLAEARDRVVTETADVQRALAEARTLLGERGAELERLATAHAETGADRDTWRSQAEALLADRDSWRSQAEALLGDRDAWRSQAEALLADRDAWRSQAEALLADRDAWRTEAEALARDRDAWRTEAENWRRETVRLIGERERRLRLRVRRVAFRVARSIWWLLPAFVRDFVRPIVFPSARATKLESGPTGTSAASHAGAPVPPRAGAPASVLPPPAAPPAPPLPPGAAAPASTRAPRRRDRTLATQISIVVPTLDGGQCFERLLSSIRRQEGIPTPEIVVVDSGSTDGTPERAQGAGARVVSITPEVFGHGRTRNYAASLARGEILVMMVQDAILLGRTALRDLALELLETERIAAVSARQVPRADADLYAAFAVCAHYSAIWGARANGHASTLGRRAAASIDDVCAAIRRPAWEEIQFADVDFAEDLDFGVRALERGWSVRLSRRAAVAHSHTRGALYHLKRSIADRLYVAPLLGDGSITKASAADLDTARAAASTFLAEMQGALSLAVVEPAPLDTQLAELRRLLEARPPRMPPTGSLSELDSFLNQADREGVNGAILSEFRREFFGLLDWPPLGEFARAQRNVDPAPAIEFAVNLAASATGSVLGDVVRIHGESPERQRLLAGV